MAITRISVTIPEDVLSAADEHARRLGRSRSWLVAEALRQLVERAAEPAGEVPRVAEPVTAYATGLGGFRLRQLEADLALSVDDRVHAAERSALVARLRRPSWNRDRLILFDRYEEYLDWSRWQEAVPE
jgi:hypothetical protein